MNAEPTLSNPEGFPLLSYDLGLPRVRLTAVTEGRG